MAPAIPTEVFDTCWRFAAERQMIFFRRLEGAAFPWTQDPILQRYKFTNAYRASDRVSQYLIKQVIYRCNPEPIQCWYPPKWGINHLISRGDKLSGSESF
jgi:hypothetical protein